jgi:hypothetical protein
VIYELLAGTLPYSDGGARPNGQLYGNGRGLSVDQVPILQIFVITNICDQGCQIYLRPNIPNWEKI